MKNLNLKKEWKRTDKEENKGRKCKFKTKEMKKRENKQNGWHEEKLVNEQINK